MNLYLMRHGIALDIGERGIDRDAERPLSEEGRRKIAWVARGLQGLGVAPQGWASSPLLRARQTVEIVARRWTSPPQIEICEALAPGGTPRDFLDWLRERPSWDWLAVGHMPDLSDLAGSLLFGSAGAEVEFKKGAVACLACEGTPRLGSFRLQWLMPPRAFRMMPSSKES